MAFGMTAAGHEMSWKAKASVYFPAVKLTKVHSKMDNEMAEARLHLPKGLSMRGDSEKIGSKAMEL